MHFVIGFLLGVGAALVTTWLALVIALRLMRPTGLDTADYLRLLPDFVALVQGLARDDAIPWAVRARLWILFAWMVSPIDLIPDAIPVIGFVDDFVLLYVVLRSVVRATDADVLRRHWRGSDDGLAALERLLRVRRPDAPGTPDAAGLTRRRR